MEIKNRIKPFYSLVLTMGLACLLIACNTNTVEQQGTKETEPKQKTSHHQKIQDLLSKMTLEEKLGQMSQMHSSENRVEDHIKVAIQKGRVSSILNQVNPEIIRKLQRIAVEKSRLGIPLIFARDIIHGFKTIFPIPLGISCSWNPELVESATRVAATEAASVGLKWSFAPMIDLTRDPRWGRIAESFGEDPLLSTTFGVATVKGFQGEDLSAPTSLAACGKHFVGYGASEGGRDYNSARIPLNDLHNIHLPPFKACVENGLATIMSGFHDLNGIPASGNPFALKEVLKKDWGFDGIVVSDWQSILEMIPHGFAETPKEAGLKGLTAGVDMEMVSSTYLDYTEEFIQDNQISQAYIDSVVYKILKLKFDLGLFDNPYVKQEDFPEMVNDEHRQVAYEASVQSCVLLKNENNTLPLDATKLSSIAVIGPLSNDDYEQLGTWVFDGNPAHTITPLMALKKLAGEDIEINFVKTLKNSRSKDTAAFDEAIKAAQAADVVLLFLGEESILSGEAHCRAILDLPGAQPELLRTLAKTNKPIITTIMAGRPLALTDDLPFMNALLYAWHPGTMGGPAIIDLLFGKRTPSGKLTATFPKTSGQIPVYYSHRNTGRPYDPESFTQMDDIPERVFQTSLGNTSQYIDVGFAPLFPFGFGLSYTTFEYSNLSISTPNVKGDQPFEVSLDLKNSGSVKGAEVVQLYIRDQFGSFIRPVKELVAFKKIILEPGASKRITFPLTEKDLAYYYPGKGWDTETGKFDLFVGGSSETILQTTFNFQKN